MYHDGLLSGRFDEPDDSGGPSYTPEVYYPDVALFWHSIGGAIVGIICFVVTIWYPSSWLFKLGMVITGLASFLFLLWFGIVIAKRIWPQAVRKNPIIRMQLLEPGEGDPDGWIILLPFCTILSFIAAYSWSWQLHIGIFITLSVAIAGLLLCLVFDRINNVFVFRRLRK